MAAMPNDPRRKRVTRGVKTGLLWATSVFAATTVRCMCLPVFCNGGKDGIELAFASENGTLPTYIEITGSFDTDGKFIGKGLLKTDGEPREKEEIEVDVEPRWHGLGWKMEARIPLELLGDLAVTRSQIVRRIVKDPRSGRMIKISEPMTVDVADLPAKFHFKATLSTTVEGQPRLLQIPHPGSTLTEAP